MPGTFFSTVGLIFFPICERNAFSDEFQGTQNGVELYEQIATIVTG